mgnify:CR=1 FL=1
MKRYLAFLLLFGLMIGCEGDYTIYDMHPPEVVYVEVPVEVLVEVPVEVPGEGGDVWIDSFEQPFTMDGIDIVWLIDKSGSMNQHANSVVAGIEQMMLSLPSAGWRLGITTTAWYNSGSTQEFPLVPGDSVQDAWDAYNNTGNHGTEAGFDALYAYLIENTYNQSWLRPDAGLLVVFVSDENEQSTRDFTSTATGLQDFINWYGNQRNSVFLASVVNVHQTQNDCSWLIVFVDFVVMPADEWQYNATTNSVEFLVVPPEGALVEIGYVIDHGSGDDDDSAGDDDDSAGN